MDGSTLVELPSDRSRESAARGIVLAKWRARAVMRVYGGNLERPNPQIRSQCVHLVCYDVRAVDARLKAARGHCLNPCFRVIGKPLRQRAVFKVQINAGVRG